MQNVTKAFKQAIHSNNRRMALRMKIQTSFFSFDLTHEDVIAGSFTTSNAIIKDNISIGTAIAGTCDFTLKNTNNKYQFEDFEGGQVTVQVGVYINDTDVEYVKLGQYIIEKVNKTNHIAVFKCADNMVLLDKPFKGTGLAGKVSCLGILLAIQSYCAVPIDAKTTQLVQALNCNIELQEESQNSCRDMISIISALVGGYAIINRDGILQINGYPRIIRENIIDGNTPQIATIDGSGSDTFIFDAGTLARRYFENEPLYKQNILDGNPPQIADIDFSGSNTLIFDGGNLFESGTPGGPDIPKYVEFTPSERFTFKQLAETITIGSLDAKIGDEIVKYGYGDYSISINADIKIENAEQVYGRTYQSVKGLTYTPFNFTYYGDPSIDVGDSIINITKTGQKIVSFVGAHKFKLGGICELTADGKSLIEKDYKDATLKRIANATARINETTDKKISAYEQESARFNDLMTNSMGAYRSETTDEQTGAKIFYIHDKPKREDSQTIWKYTSDGFAVSTDGGNTWNSGMDRSGNLVAKMISVVGLNAEWIYLNGGDTTPITQAIDDIKDGDIDLENYKGKPARADTLIKAGSVTTGLVDTNLLTADMVNAQVVSTVITKANTGYFGTIKAKDVDADTGRFGCFRANGQQVSVGASVIKNSAWTNLSGQHINALEVNVAQIKELYAPMVVGTLHGRVVGSATSTMQYLEIEHSLKVGTGIGIGEIEAKSMYCSGAVRALDFIKNSDKRLKKNIKKAPNQIIDDILNIKIKEFKYKLDPNNTVHIGVIAQEVEADTTVLKDYLIKEYETSEGTYKAISTDTIAMGLVKVVQSQDKEIKSLKGEIDRLRDEIDQIKALIGG